MLNANTSANALVRQVQDKCGAPVSAESLEFRAMSLGQQVRSARTARALSQIKLAETAGVSQTTVSKLERGGFDATPSEASIQPVLRALGLTPSPASNTPPAPMQSRASEADELRIESAAGAHLVPGRHLPRDATAVARTVAPRWTDFVGDPDTPEARATLERCAGAWLDAAAELRRRGFTATPEALMIQCTISLLAKIDSR